jgi:hypothetical protein
VQRDDDGSSRSSSCAGLTRASILFVKTFCEVRWIAGSSPAMTTRMGMRANSCAAFVDVPRLLGRNREMYEMTAGPVSLLPDCYLQ